MMAGKAFGLFLVILAALTMDVEGKFNYSKGIAYFGRIWKKTIGSRNFSEHF